MRLRILSSLGAALLIAAGLTLTAGVAAAQTTLQTPPPPEVPQPAQAEPQPPVVPPAVVVKTAGGEVSLKLGGLIQAQFDGGDRGDARFTNGDDRFYLRRARLNATGSFLEQFDFRFEMDLAGSLGNTSGFRAQLTDGYINWNRYAAANVRAGQFKTPFGFEQLYADPRLLTIERSMVNDRLTLNRQIGVQLGGDLLDKRLSYAVGTFNGNGVNTNANDNNRLDTVGRLSGIPWQGELAGGKASWSIGVDGFTANDTALALTSDLGIDSTPTTADRDGIFTGKRHGFGADSQFVSGPFELWVEYLRTRFEPANSIPSARFQAVGGYVQVSLFLVPKKFQIVVKQETFDPNDDISKNQTDTTTLGLNYYIHGHDLKLMADYLRVKAGRLDSQDKVLARLQVAF
jgi:phosphate-selective porin OprO/OprP